MRLLLDTHIFIWASTEPSRLSKAATAVIRSGDSDIYVSAATAWEIAIKVAVARLEFRLDRFGEMLSTQNFVPLDMTVAHGMAAGSLPRHHNDPFDRMLIAQARIEGLTIITVDRAFDRYDVPLLG